VTLVSGSYFPVLGLKPEIGRLIGTDDDKATGEAHLAVLSYDYWQIRFEGKPDALNQVVYINGQPMTIIGVAPRGFTGTTLGIMPRIFIPVTFRGRQPFLGMDPDRRTSYWLYIFGRLQPGVTLEQTAAVMNIQYRNITNEYDAPEIEQWANSSIMEMFRAKQLTLKPGACGQSTVPDSNRETMRIQMVSALLILLIACANVCSILVTRGMARAGEIAVRSSFGATRGQIITQLLAESFVLVIISGISSIFTAHWILRLIVSIYPPHSAPLFDLSLNETSLLFTALLMFSTVILVGLFPAIHGARPDQMSLTKDQTGRTTESKTAFRLRVTLIVAQIALSLTLLVVSGLFAKSLYRLSNTDLGMKTDNIITFRVSPLQAGYTQEQTGLLFERLEEELAAIPGVSGVTSSQSQMFRGNTCLSANFIVEGIDPGRNLVVCFDNVGFDYLNTLGVPLVSGRNFTK